MNTSGIIASLAIGIGLLAAPAAHASDDAIPDRTRLQTMSREEFAAYREQIHNRAEGSGAAQRRPTRDAGGNGRSLLDGRNDGGGYGQGYGSRQGAGQGSGYGRGGGLRR